jgi:hypothetical protein
MQGTLTQASIPGGIYQWTATRPGGIQVPVPPDFDPLHPAGSWESFTPDIRSYAAQPGRVFPLKQGDFPAGRYMIYVAPTGKNGLSAPNNAKAFGPYTLRSEKRYKAWIHTSGKVLGWEEESADLLRYLTHPLPGFARIYFRNNVDGDEWYAICVLPAGPTGGGGGDAGIDIIAGIWKNTDHIHQGCKVVQSFCLAYKVDVLFSKEPGGALKGQLVGQQFFMVGNLQGQTWKISMTMNGLAHGNGNFEFSPDFRSFKGELTDVNGHHVVWTGKR